MTEPVHPARRTPVADCRDRLALGRPPSEQPATRTPGVVDGEGGLSGVVGMPRLTQSGFARVVIGNGRPGRQIGFGVLPYRSIVVADSLVIASVCSWLPYRV